MKFDKKAWIGTAALLVIVLAAACSPRGSASVATPSVGEQEAEYQALMVDLGARGAQVQPVGVAEAAQFGTQGRQMTVNGQPVQVALFQDEVQRLSAQDQLTSNPGLIPETGTSSAQVYVWGEGRLMAIYVGNDQAVIDAMTASMGEPVLIMEGGSVG